MSFPRYPKYKPSGVEWLGKIPEKWSIVPLKSLANFVNGNAFKPADWVETGTPIIRIQNLNGGEEFNFIDGPIESRYLVKEGDLLFGWSGNRGTSFGPFRWTRTGIYALNQHIFKVEPWGLDGDYLYWILKAATSHIEDQAHGIIGMVHVTKGDLGSIKVPVALETDQKSIASFLDHETAKIDALIAEQQRLIELLKEKRQAVISHAVTKGLNPHVRMKDSGVEWLGEVPEHWEVKKLIWLLYESPKNGISPQINENGQTPTFSIAAVKNGTTDIRNNLKYADISLKDAKPYLVQKDDILVLRGNGNKALVGTAGIVTEEPPTNCIYPDILIRIRPSNLINPWYLVSVLNSEAMRPGVEMAAQTASGVWKISGKSLQDLRFAFPPSIEQLDIERRISGVIDTFDLLQAVAERAIELLQERRTALISAAVTGQIDVRGFQPVAA